MNILETVASVAVLIDDEARFRARAAEVAKELGWSRIEGLSNWFTSPPLPEPPGFGYPERRLGGWLSAWQFAIFELFYNCGEDGLPALRKVAFGQYDWTQGNAIEVLVRLAARGIDRERIIADVRREFPGIRYEAQIYTVAPLLDIARHNPAVAAVVRELEDLPEWQDAVEELRADGLA